VPELRRHLIGLAAIFAVTTLAVVGPHRRGNHTRVLVTFGLAAAIVILQVRMALPVVERVKPGPMIAAAVRAAVPADVPVAAAGFREPSLAFYLDRSFTELGSGEVEGWLDAPGDGVLITEARLLGDERRQLEEIARYEGINISNGRQVVVVAVRR
jgi:hypothetical protein